MTHTHAHSQGQRSLGSKLECKRTDRRTDGSNCITSRANAVGRLHVYWFSHEEIKRVGRVGRGCYEDASNLSAKVVRVGLVEFGKRHDTRTNGQHYTPQQTVGNQSGQRVAS